MGDGAFFLDRVGDCVMPVWEYREIDLNDLPPKTDEVDVLNELGAEGWELVGILENHVAYLKRRRDDGIGRAKAERRSVG